MLLNYLKLALRLLVRNPFFTLINVLGLSMGFASFFILYQYSMSELKTDQYHKDFQRIGRIGCYWSWKEELSTGQMKCGSIPIDQLRKITEDFSQIEDHTRIIEGVFRNEGINSPGSLVFSVEDGKGGRISFKEERVVSADPNLFRFFNIPLILGNKQEVLRSPNAVAISQTMAAKYFGNEQPINRVLILNDSIPLIVTGVFADLPKATHLDFRMVLSNQGEDLKWEARKWGQCYIKLNTANGFEKLAEGINRKKQRYWGAELRRWTASDAEMFVQPLEEIAFSDYYWGDYFVPKSKFILNILFCVSLLVLIMAWINYMNFAFSNTMRRLKEVATRKVTGAQPGDLVKQFFVESLVVHLLAIGVALTIIQLIRQPLNVFFQVRIPEFQDGSPDVWLAFVLVPLAGIAITAMYPALLSISYNAHSLYKFKRTPGLGRFISPALTTFQYSAAIVLLLWAFLVYSQLDFIFHKDLGINKSSVVMLDVPATKSAAYETNFYSFITEVQRFFPATYGHTLIGDPAHWRMRMKHPGQADYFQVDSNGGVDESFIPFFGISLLAGRNFISNDRDDVVIVSRYITERLGFTDPFDAIGASIQVEDGSIDNVEIIGVMEDYPLRPFVNYGETGHPNMSRADGICLTFKTGSFSGMIPGKIAVRINPGTENENISTLQNLFHQTFPGSEFNTVFLDDHINKAYDQEKVLSGQIALFTALAIGIACLGLLSIISGKVEEKTKEIGIRKVLGAGIGQIGSVLLETTIWQIALAILVGMPVAYYLGHEYLTKFSQRIDLQWWHFAVPVALLLMILFTTISSMLWRAAKSNPVEALKYE